MRADFGEPEAERTRSSVCVDTGWTIPVSCVQFGHERLWSGCFRILHQSDGGKGCNRFAGMLRFQKPRQIYSLGLLLSCRLGHRLENPLELLMVFFQKLLSTFQFEIDI
jgi:hypothetical protein